MSYVKKALEIATKAHEGQFRHDKVTPYIEHPKSVAKLFKKEYKGVAWYRKDAPQIIEAACLLHDVLEDCMISSLYNDVLEANDRPITGDDLVSEGMSTDIVNLVEELTHKPFENYAQYIERIRVNTDFRVSLIKRFDLKHNLRTLAPKKRAQRDKYLLALYILEH